MANPSFGFIGAGRMATALAKGLRAANLASADRIVASDPLPESAEHFARETGGRLAATNREVLAGADVVFLAVKPQNMAEVLSELHGHATRDHLVISIAAGIPLSTLAAGLGDGPRLVRVMPNTPCLVGAGASGYCLGPGATLRDGAMVAELLGAVGTAHEVKESLLDAVTGLSGSGPALVYVIIEALSDGGVKVGLPRSVATALAAQTVRGAAEMVLKTGQHPAVLKDAVASPGGTTIAGLAALETGGVRATLIAAVEAATRRSAELGALSKSKSS
jgi:pyrroline-5-carboxylate reductase